MNPIFLVLDGPDAAGKTTLARRLQELEPDTLYIHLSYIADDRSMYQANWIALNEARKSLARGCSVVLDRSWMSENIYSSVYRGGSKIGAMVRALDRMIQRLCGVYVVCAPTVESAVRRHANTAQSGREMYQPDDRIRQVAERYFAIVKGFPLEGHRDYVDSWVRHHYMRNRQDVTHYDVDLHGNNMDDILAHARRMASMLQRSQLRSFEQWEYLGSPYRAKYVVVTSDDQLPFVEWTRRNEITNDHIQNIIDLDESYVMWVPLTSARNSIAEFSRGRRVLAIGHEAKTACLAENVNYHSTDLGTEFLSDLTRFFSL